MHFNKYARYYLSSLLTREVKHELLSFFYRSQKTISRDLTNYVEVRVNSHMQRAYTKDLELRKLLNEVQLLEIGSLDYETKLSTECVMYLNKCYRDKYYSDTEDAIIRNKLDSPQFDRYVNDRLKDIKEYCASHFIDIAFEEDGNLNSEYLNNVFNKGYIYDFDKKMVQTISYAINENREDMVEYDENGKLVLKEWAFKKYIIDYEPIPLTTKEKIRKSLDNTYRTFIDYARCNLSLFKYFVTLTFAPIAEKEKHIEYNKNRLANEYDLTFKYVNDSTSIDECSKVLHLFFNKMKIQLKRRSYELFYLGVPEFQKNGSIHYHFLMSNIPQDLFYKMPKWLDMDYLHGYTSKDGIGLKSWSYGKSDVELINDKSRITTYISKYMIKSFNDISDTIYLERLNKQRYYKSNNLIKPKELTEEEYELVKEDVESNYISLYQIETKNLYSDNIIVKKLYQLRDL